MLGGQKTLRASLGEKVRYRDEQTITQLLQKMLVEVNGLFREQQLTHFFTALGTKIWAKHSVDFSSGVQNTFYVQ
jgi:hypothetical protein